MKIPTIDEWINTKQEIIKFVREQRLKYRIPFSNKLTVYLQINPENIYDLFELELFGKQMEYMVNCELIIIGPMLLYHQVRGVFG